ncbi:hypothetical protein KCU94_g14964, partial [Aureobasidium melanogenum]
LAAKAVAPAALTVAFSAVVHACAVHGLYTVTSIFGPQDSRRILQPLIDNIWTAARPVDQLRNFMQHWRLRIGLPLITPLLILSRTTLADSILPVLPIVFFATQGDTSDTLDMISWPPSASMTFAVLPYIRSAYNTYHQRVWAEREQKWLKEIQPRSGQQDVEANAQVAVDAEIEAAEEDNNFEIRIDGNIWEEWAGGEDDVLLEVQEGQAHPLNAPPLPDDAPLPPQNQGQNQNIPQAPRPQQNPPPPPPQNREERLLSFGTNSLAQTVMSALLFPTIASVSGDLLTYILPRSWTTLPMSKWGVGRGIATGLLQNKWGRSVVGGCLFVVVKDAVMLYKEQEVERQGHTEKSPSAHLESLHDSNAYPDPTIKPALSPDQEQEDDPDIHHMLEIRNGFVKRASAQDVEYLKFLHNLVHRVEVIERQKLEELKSAAAADGDDDEDDGIDEDECKTSGIFKVEAIAPLRHVLFEFMHYD